MIRIHTFNPGIGGAWDGRWSAWWGEPYEGRCLVRGEWARFRRNVGVSFNVDADEGEIAVSVALGWTLWLVFSAPRLRGGQRRLSELRLTHDEDMGLWLWARLWCLDDRGAATWWDNMRRGWGLNLSTSLSDRLWGSSRYSSETLAEGVVDVELPEGRYAYRVRVARDSWSWSRWPTTQHMTRLHADVVDDRHAAPDLTRKGWDNLHGLTSQLRIRPDCTWDAAMRWTSPPSGGEEALLRLAKRQLELNIIEGRLTHGGIEAVLGLGVEGA